MSIEIGQPVLVVTSDFRGTGKVISKPSPLDFVRVQLDSGPVRMFVRRHLFPINGIEEGRIGGTDAEDDEMQERSM